jgi:RNA polymerase sigma-70 factor (ECF subfamily)
MELSQDTIDRIGGAQLLQTDESTFSVLSERYRRELHIHCYRMMGSLEDAEDLVQETLLRAWRHRENFEGRSSFRAWLYRIATNTCLDALDRRPDRRLGRQKSSGPHGERSTADEVLWLQPYPDRWLDEIATSDDQPDALIVSKETIELAFLVAVQHLPPRPRAALILRDVLGWSASETASALETSVAATNSALQRARSALKSHLPERRLDWSPPSEQSEGERALAQRYLEATERLDVDAVKAMLAEEVRFSMPPTPGLYVGRDNVVNGWVEGGFGSGDYRDWRCLITFANRQPAVANYLRREGESEYRAFAMDVLRINLESGMIDEIMTFEAPVFPAFGLPETL